VRRVLEGLVAALDVVAAPLTLLSALWLKVVRRVGVQRMRVARGLFRRVGVFPVRDHYYEPLFQPRHLTHSLREVRDLPGVDLDVPSQLAMIAQLRFDAELGELRGRRNGDGAFSFDNESFGPGDAEVLYGMLRHWKPRRMVEIGSGRSTRVAARALARNREEDPARASEHVCVEPYEMPWLETLGVRVVRERVERAAPELFDALRRNDVLFIDSSHVIRPQGDVVFEYLELLPRLASGVVIHVHDITTPRDVPDDWIHHRVRFWNEQYLLEAFLSFNRDFRVIAALNQLKHDHFEALAAACPVLREEPWREPGSFWMVRA
jgi:predicted O-methyltransferase YrrM